MLPAKVALARKDDVALAKSRRGPMLLRRALGGDSRRAGIDDEFRRLMDGLPAMPQ
jgi:hypothetical protein